MHKQTVRRRRQRALATLSVSQQRFEVSPARSGPSTGGGAAARDRVPTHVSVRRGGSHSGTQQPPASRESLGPGRSGEGARPATGPTRWLVARPRGAVPFGNVRALKDGLLKWIEPGVGVPLGHLMNQWYVPLRKSFRPTFQRRPKPEDARRLSQQSGNVTDVNKVIILNNLCLTCNSSSLILPQEI